MTQLILTKAPVAVAEMLIRRPVAEVFEESTRERAENELLELVFPGRHPYGRDPKGDEDSVKAVEPHARILVEWPGYGSSTTVEWIFTAREDGSTFVSITNAGFGGDGDQATHDAISSTEGFTIVLAGLKALLEHGLQLNLVADRFPRES